MSREVSRADAATADEWAGEVRVNRMRLAALVVFYGYHLLDLVLSGDAAVGGAFHLSATALAMVWSVGVAGLYFLLSRRPPPTALKYAVTAWDVVLITVLVMLAGGPKSPLVLLYFLVIAAAPLRRSLPLVYVATLASAAAYAFLLGHYAFAVVGSERYYANPALRVPRTQEAITVLTLLGCGAFAGQVVRQVRRVAGADDVAVVGRVDAWVGAGLVVMALLVGFGLLAPWLGVAAAQPAARGRAAVALWALVAVFVAAVAAAAAEARPPAGERRPGTAERT